MARAKGLRACPICPNCNSKKFRVVENENTGKKVTVECLKCNYRITI